MVDGSESIGGSAMVVGLAATGQVQESRSCRWDRSLGVMKGEPLLFDHFQYRLYGEDHATKNQ